MTSPARSWSPHQGRAYVINHSGVLDVHAARKARCLLQSLVDHAVALGQFQQRLQLFSRGIAIQVEMEANVFEPYRRLLAHAEGAAKVEVSLRRDRTAAERVSQRRGNSTQRSSG